MKNWIQTLTGKKIFLDSPQPGDFDILDIAHGLALTCRYSGQCGRFYSVAEHSINVMQHLPDELKFAGLMHDASEAYIHDITRPVKCWLNAHGLNVYHLLEDNFMLAIAERFEFQYPINHLVKYVDNKVILTERRDVVEDQDLDWEIPGEPYPESTMEFSINTAVEMFLAMFHYHKTHERFKA